MPRPIHHCELTESLGSGGIETRVTRVLSRLPREDFRLSWIGFARSEPLIERAGPGVRVIELEKHRHDVLHVDLSLLARVTARLRELAPDVVRVHNWSTSLYGILGARLAGVPSVIYESAGRESPEPPSAKRRAAMHVLAPLVDVFCTVCPFLSKELVDEWGVPEARVRSMPTGVDLSRFSPDDRRAARARFGVPLDGFVVGTIGMFRKVKRVDDIVEAGVRLLAARPDAQLLVLGDDFERGIPERFLAAARAVNAAERAHFPGRVAGAESAIAAFDVFVNASSFEGASNAIIEAMAAGVPVVATTAGGNVDVVLDGETGLLVPVGRPDRIYEALSRLSSDPALHRRLGARAREVAVERHGIDGMAAEYEALFRELAAHAPRGPAARALRIARRVSAATFLGGLSAKRV